MVEEQEKQSYWQLLSSTTPSFISHVSVVCVFNLLCHSVHDLMYHLGNGLNKMKLHGQMHLEGFADAAHEL